MKINKLTVTAIAVAAFTTAPLFTPAITSFAATNTAKTTTTATTAEKPINKMGWVNGDDSIDTFDAHGNSRNHPIKETLLDFYVVSQVKINGQDFYRLHYDTYVRTSDVTLSNDDGSGYRDFSSGNIRGISTEDAPETFVYDVNGKPTGEVLPAHTTLPSTGLVKTNHDLYFKIDHGYVLVREVVRVVWRVNEVKVNGTVTVKNDKLPEGNYYNPPIYNDEDQIITTPKGALALIHGTSWKVFYKVDMNGVTFYNLGGNQFVDARAVIPHVTVVGSTNIPSQTPTKPSRPSTQKVKVGTVHYVPGYGIQVWTKNHVAVHNADGSLKKLAHKTSWKVFDETTINGKAFYNLGGDQWIEANYMSLR